MWKRIKNWLKQYKALVNCVHIVRAAGEGSYLVCCVRDYTSSKIIRKVIKILVTPFCMVRYFFRRDIAGREGLAFVLIAKNEALYIKEWLDFHLKQGVSHFFIYDNESTDNFREVLEPYINSGVVTYRFLKGHPRQSDAYNMALVKNRRKFKYMGFIDADEFVFIRNSTGGGCKSNLYTFVDEFMTSHPEAGGLAINWCIFGSNGHRTKPDGGVLRNFTRRAKDNDPSNIACKTICDTNKIFTAGVHYPILYCKGFYTLDENGDIIDTPWPKQVHFDKIRINHYFIKSYEEFKAKRARGRGTNPGLYGMDFFDRFDKNEVVDTEILSHI